MLNSVRMKKLTAIVLDEKKEDVLRDLKEMGTIHLIDAQEEGYVEQFGISPAKTSWVRVTASDLLSRIDRILEIFNIVDEDSRIKSMLKNIIEEEVEKKPVTKVNPSDFFDTVDTLVKSLEGEVTSISSKLEELDAEREELINAKRIISLIGRLGIGPIELEGYKSSMVWAGIVQSSEIQEIKKEIGELTEYWALFFEELNKKESIVLTVVLKEYEVGVNRILRTHHFDRLQIPPDMRSFTLEEASSWIESRLSSIEKSEKELKEKLREISGAHKDKLLGVRESLQIEKVLDDVNPLFCKTVKTYTLMGWVPSTLVAKTVETIKKASQGYCTISTSNPAEGENPPTLLKNPAPVKQWEILTNTYGIPSYDELDPTKVISLTFPLVFGIMFGDVGQGLLLVLMGYFLGFRLKVMESLMNLGRVIFVSGLFATLMGFFYGSVFGLEIIHHPYLLPPLEDSTTLISFSLYLGLAILTLGIVLNVFKELLHRKYFEAFFDHFGVVGFWLLWGGVTTYLKHSSNPIDIGKDITAIPAILIPLILLGIGKRVEEKMGIGMILLDIFETLIVFISNSISFIRIAAIAIVHASLFAVMLEVMFVTLPGTQLNPSIILSLQILVFLIGNLIIFLMEALSAFIQSIRLHYYEFFSKFYIGGGHIFKPLKVIRKYTYLKT